MMSTKFSRAKAGIEVRQYVVVDRPESALRPVFHALIEGSKDAVLEVRAWVGGRHRVTLLGRQILSAEAEHIGLDTCCYQSDFGIKEFGYAGRRV